MNDVLKTLQKLPLQCASVMGDQAVFIRRGAYAANPAFIPVTEVDLWNERNGVKPHERRAMEAGLACGWDAKAADPDVQLREAGQPAEPEKVWTFEGMVVVQMKVRCAGTEDQAIELADNEAAKLVDRLREAEPELHFNLLDDFDLTDVS